MNARQAKEFLQKTQKKLIEHNFQGAANIIQEDLVANETP